MKTSNTPKLNRHIGAGVTSSRHAVLTARHIAELPWRGTLGSRRGIHEVDGDGERLDDPGRVFARHPVKVRTTTTLVPSSPIRWILVLRRQAQLHLGRLYFRLKMRRLPIPNSA